MDRLRVSLKIEWVDNVGWLAGRNMICPEKFVEHKIYVFKYYLFEAFVP